MPSRYELASRLVDREVYYCVSSLVTDLSALVIAAPHGTTDIYWDTDIAPLMESTNFEEAGMDHINDCDDLDDLETMANDSGYWEDAISKTEWAEDREYLNDEDEMNTMTFEEWYEAFGTEAALEAIRKHIIDSVSDWEAFCETFDVDLDDHHDVVYEHWLISNWLARKLGERGESVGELCGLTIWGRTCTGQSIALDSVIEQIACQLWPEELEEKAA